MANNPFDPPIVQVKKLLDRNGMGTVNHGFGSRRTVAPTSRPAPAPELPPEGVKNLSELGDVDTASPTVGDVLTWDGTNWVPDVPPDEGIDPTLLDAKGDLIVATAADTPTRLPVGSAGQVLTVDPSEATGVKWSTPSVGGASAVVAFTVPTGALATGGSYRTQGFVVSCQRASTITGVTFRIGTTAGVTYRFALWSVNPTTRTLVAEVGGIDVVATTTSGTWEDFASGTVSWALTAGTTYVVILSTAAAFVMAWGNPAGEFSVAGVGNVPAPGGMALQTVAPASGVVMDWMGYAGYRFWARIDATA